MSAAEVLAELQRSRAERDYSSILSKLDTASRRFSGNRSIQLECAKLFLEIKKPELAARHFNIVNELDKKQRKIQHFDVILGLARAVLAGGDPKNAKELLVALEQRKPDDPSVLGLLAQANWLLKEDETADSYALRAYEYNRDDKDAVYAYGLYLVRSGSVDEAVQIFERNIDHAPPHSDSIDKWLELVKKKEQWRYAKDKLHHYALKYPTIIEFVYGLAVVSNTLGEVDSARDFYLKTIEISPNNSRVLYELGVLERVAGNIVHSEELIRRSLDLNPDNPAALRTIGTDHKYTVDDLEAKPLHLAAARLTDMSSQDQVHMHYALGKYFEDIGHLDTAFRHYSIGGQKKNKIEPFDIKVATAQIDMLKKYVTKNLVTQTGQLGFPSSKPIFVLGMPRSGTSLLEQVLSSHPEIYGAGELKYVMPVIENIAIGSDGRILLGHKEPVFSKDENATYHQRGEAYVKYLSSLAGDGFSRVVDKMPGNFNFLGLIHAILPNAKILHSRRHPVETCLSNYRINFAEGQLWSYNLANLGKYYRLYWDLMKHWRAEFPDAFLDVRYEDNVFDLEASSKRIMQYLDLDWRQGMMDFHSNTRPVKTASLTQVRKPIYKTSTNRWRKYEKFLGPLLEELGDIVPEYEAEIAHLAEK